MNSSLNFTLLQFSIYLIKGVDSGTMGQIERVVSNYLHLLLIFQFMQIKKRSGSIQNFRTQQG